MVGGPKNKEKRINKWNSKLDINTLCKITKVKDLAEKREMRSFGKKTIEAKKLPQKSKEIGFPFQTST